MHKSITARLAFTALLLFVLGCGKFLPPPIPPQPNPNPTPTPIAGDLWLILIEESSATSTAFAELKNDLPFWSDLASRGVRHFVYDDDLPAEIEGSRPADAARIRKYVDLVNGIDRPSLIAIKPDGTAVLKQKSPETRPEMEQILKRLGK